MAFYNPSSLSSEELCCPICFEEYDNNDPMRLPKLLLCLHTYCYQCCQTLRSDVGTIPCSICRAVHKNVTIRDLLDNYVIANYLRKQQEISDAEFARETAARIKYEEDKNGDRDVLMNSSSTSASFRFLPPDNRYEERNLAIEYENNSAIATNSPPGISTLWNENFRVLVLEVEGTSLDYPYVTSLAVPFGCVERMKGQMVQDYYFCFIKFASAGMACLGQKGLHNKKIGQKYLCATVVDVNEMIESEDDFIPHVDDYMTIDAPHHSQKDPLWPVYNIVTVEQGHDLSCVFSFLKSICASPVLDNSALTNLGRNSYLLKVLPHQGIVLQRTDNFMDSGILSVKAHDEFNGSKGVISNTYLGAMKKQDLLACCSSNVIDAFNLSVWDCRKKAYVSSPSIIVKFSSDIPPKQLTIGAFKVKVFTFFPNPKMCSSCLKFGHSAANCRNTRLCRMCTRDHLDEHCTRPIVCYSCKGPHYTFNNICPEFAKQKEIARLAYFNKTGYRDAKYLYSALYEY